MRRFSARNHLVTLHEINITPLLDLAFVLLIIFIITSPLLEQSIDLRLPAGGSPRPVANVKDTVVAEVSATGIYKLAGRAVANQAEMERLLGVAYRANSNLVLLIRADRDGKYEYPASIIAAAQRQGISKFSLSTEPTPRR